MTGKQDPLRERYKELIALEEKQGLDWKEQQEFEAIRKKLYFSGL